jgi:hypothetical protein
MRSDGALPKPSRSLIPHFMAGQVNRMPNTASVPTAILMTSIEHVALPAQPRRGVFLIHDPTFRIHTKALDTPWMIIYREIR